MIEAKNSELKNIHGYSRCDAAGLSNMQLQGAVSIFAVNLKRILKLKEKSAQMRKNRKIHLSKGWILHLSKHYFSNILLSRNIFTHI